MSSLVASHITVVQVAAAASPTVPPASTEGAMEADFPLLLARQLVAEGQPLTLGASPAAGSAEPAEKGLTEEGGTGEPGAVSGLSLPGLPILPMTDTPAEKVSARVQQSVGAEPAPSAAPDPAGLPAKLAAGLPKLQPEGDESPSPTPPAAGDSAAGLASVAAKASDSHLAVAARPEGPLLPMAPAPHAGGPVRAEMPAAAAAVPVPLGSVQWGTEFAQKVVWLAREQQSMAQIQVTPPQLGPIEIRLSLSHDQANMTFVSPHAAVREAIEAALPRLREMFAESGLTLGNVDVAAQSFGGQGHREGEGYRSAPPAQGLLALGGGLSPWRKGEGLVDVFA